MPGAIRGFLGFTRELDRGLAMVRGEVKPGTYNRRHASVRRKNGRSSG